MTATVFLVVTVVVTALFFDFAPPIASPAATITQTCGPVDLHPLQGFAAETTSASAILASAHMGFGLSTTQVCAGSVMGSGAGRRPAHVRWRTAGRIGLGWLLGTPSPTNRP